MSSDIVAAQISTKPITYTREKAGWIWQEDRAEQLGKFQVNLCNISVVLVLKQNNITGRLLHC